MKAEFKNIVPIKKMRGEDAADTKMLKKMYLEASDYLRSHSWCKKIKDAHFGLGVGGIVAVFLFEILPNGKADNWLWVVVGDLPSAYISAIDNETPAAALSGYVYEMGRWVDAVREGRSIEDLIPVDARPTRQMADLLSKRLDFIETKILI